VTSPRTTLHERARDLTFAAGYNDPHGFKRCPSGRRSARRRIVRAAADSTIGCPNTSAWA
jgi:hypothetical protein